MHESGNESAGFGNNLSCPDLVTNGHYRLRRCTEMLGHRHIERFRQRQNLNGTAARKLGIVRMDSADCKRYFTHC